MSSLNLRIQSIFYGNPDYYPPIINGAYLLHDEGFAQQILCREYRQRTDVTYPKSLDIIRVQPKAKNSLLEYLNFLLHAGQWGRPDTDIFIGHDMHGFLVARLLGWRFRRPVFYHCHDFVEDGRSIGLGGSLVKLFERRFARTSELVIVPDKMRAEVVQEQLHLRRPPLVVANCPLESPILISPVLRDSLESESKGQISKILLRIGQIGEGHGLEATIRSMLLWNDPGWGFVVIGPGNPQYIRSLEYLADQLNLTGRLAILPPVSYQQVSQYVAGADMGHGLYEATDINSLHNSTASNKFAEYMAAKLPILVADTPGNKTLVNKYRHGITVDATNPEDIANAVNSVFGDSQVAVDMGEASFRAFTEELNYKKQFAPVVTLLKSIK